MDDSFELFYQLPCYLFLSIQGQSAFDVADSSLLPLMEELKRKQAALKLVSQNKKGPRKRK